MGVRWYCKYSISYRELQEILAERGVNVDHTTIYRWRIMCLKWKSSLMLYEQFGNLKFKYRNREFWCRGYYVDTVGKDTAKKQDYIKHQLEEDKMGEQLSIPYPGSPFTGRK